MKMWLRFRGMNFCFVFLLYSDLCDQMVIDIFGVGGTLNECNYFHDWQRGGDGQSTSLGIVLFVCCTEVDGDASLRPRGLGIIIIYIIPYTIMQNPNSPLSILAPAPQNKLLSVPLPLHLWALFFYFPSFPDNTYTHARTHTLALLSLNNNTHTHSSDTKQACLWWCFSYTCTEGNPFQSGTGIHP